MKAKVQITRDTRNIIDSCVQAEINRLQEEVHTLHRKSGKTDEESVRFAQATGTLAKLRMAMAEFCMATFED